MCIHRGIYVMDDCKVASITASSHFSIYQTTMVMGHVIQRIHVRNEYHILLDSPVFVDRLHHMVNHTKTS